MGPIVNTQGGFKFMRLRSMKNITRLSWYIIPMPDIVVYWVNKGLKIDIDIYLSQGPTHCKW